MKILLFTPRYPPYKGGALTYFSTVVRELSGDHEYVILTSSHPEVPFSSVDQDGNKVYRMIPRLESLPSLIRLLIESTISFFITCYLLLKNDFDLCHSHSTSFAVPGLILPLIICNLPLVFDSRDVGFPKPIMTLGNSKYWLSCAENVDQRLIDSGIDPDRIIRTPVVNPDYVSKIDSSPNQPKEPFRVIFVGSIRELKGVDMLVDAFDKFSQDRDTTLTIVGEGPYYSEVKQRVSDLGTDQISFTGSVSHKKAVTMIASSDVLVLPSESEGLPRVILEALEVGTPVIATDVGSIPQVISHGENGLLIERSVPCLLNSLQYLHDNPTIYDEFSASAGSSLDRDWEQVKDAIEKAYELSTHEA